MIKLYFAFRNTDAKEVTGCAINLTQGKSNFPAMINMLE